VDHIGIPCQNIRVSCNSENPILFHLFIHHQLINMPPRTSLILDDDTALEDFRNSDVIFGTRGNGGNSTFLSRLEETADRYSHLSKYEKMECIKTIISDWHGRFFIITPDGDCSQVLEFEASPSSKLYTSVRRMMNYVIKKRSLNSKTNAKHRISNSRDKKRLRRIRVLEKEEEGEQHDDSAAPIVIKTELNARAFQDIARMEDAAIHTLVSLITSGQE
jgi:hypothetical protein